MSPSTHSPLHLLQIGRFGDDLNARLTETYPTTRLWEQANPGEVFSRRGADYNVVATSAAAGLSAAQVAALPNLEAVVCFGVGYDGVDVEACAARGIPVSNTPGVLDDCVADLALGLMLATARRLPQADAFLRSGAWAVGESFPLATRASGRRVGIVGLGRIGKAVARRAEGFSMPIRYHNRSRAAGVAYEYVDSLLELARWAEFLVVVVPGGAGTRHLVDAAVLEALGPDGVLINVARGSVVDEAALVAALTEGRLGGAGLDVFEHEPQVPQALVGLPNVVLLPHVGSATVETRRAMEDLLMANLAAFTERGTLLTPVR